MSSTPRPFSIPSMLPSSTTTPSEFRWPLDFACGLKDNQRDKFDVLIGRFAIRIVLNRLSSTMHVYRASQAYNHPAKVLQKLPLKDPGCLDLYVTRKISSGT